MPIEVGIWKLGDELKRIEFTGIPIEDRLEDTLTRDIDILDPGLLLVGRQVRTTYGGSIDLLAMDAEGNLVVIELKKDRTPREVVAQILDYGSWVRELGVEEVTEIFRKFVKKYPQSQFEGMSVDQAFRQKFPDMKDMPETINETHELLVVAGELDDSTERIVNYLNDAYGVAINAVFFRYFREGDYEFLTRVWLIDPSKAEERTVDRRTNEPWNNETYVTFGNQDNRRWDDAMNHGT